MESSQWKSSKLVTQPRHFPEGDIFSTKIEDVWQSWKLNTVPCCISNVFSLRFNLASHEYLMKWLWNYCCSYLRVPFDNSGTFLQYMNNLNYLSGEAFSSIPQELVPDLQKMLSANEALRPTAMGFTSKCCHCFNVWWDLCIYITTHFLYLSGSFILFLRKKKKEWKRYFWNPTS